MINYGVTEEERKALVAACRHVKCRFVERTRERPSEWQPTQVLDPRYADWNICFTDQTAFEFVADKIASGHPVEKVALHKPPGALGYEMKFSLPDGRVLYVKLELKGQIVFGRSFHYSLKTGK